ncbi:CHAD domain-containing protein [Hyphococcus sp.]|uniref:CYTH and CHAD domain-containing protein n=1 Tax=Hyphococcus sp. TaxID=2038636 RepID=UPI002087BCF4|nr:MAG: inorganic triphosphatase [Marinicaulis sp.]
MGAGRTEFELKLTGPPAVIAKLPQSRLFAALAPKGGGWERLVSTYFDTEDRLLAQYGLNLRLREEGAETIQAVKARGGSPASRREFESEIESATAFPCETGDAQIDKRIQSVASQLTPIAKTSVDRWADQIEFARATIELAVDLGQAESRDASGRLFAAPLAEVELELISGQKAAVFELAKLIADNAPVRLAIDSKLEFALALPKASAPLSKAPTPVVAAEDTAGDTLAAMLNASAARLASIQPAIVDLRRPEGVHQMRVALRRLRATERLFRKSLPGREINRLAAQAKQIASVLGSARDWDVFLSDALSAAQASDYAPEALKQLKAKAEAARAEAWAAAVEEISGPVFTHFLIDLLGAATLQDWRKGAGKALRQPASRLAAQQLDRALKKARKIAGDLSPEQGLAALHPLRVALKKLRYPAQLFKGLYANDKRKDYMASLSALQGALGAVNDAVTAQRLADCAAAEGGEALMRGAGFVAGYNAAKAQNGVKEIDAALAAFEKMSPFWRET